MANKSINSLVNASGLDNDDLLVLWDSGTNTAQNMTGAQFSAWLVSLANGHGGIEDFTVVDSGTAGDGRLHTATLTYAGDHSTYTFTFMDGYKGDTGPQTYVFLKYADHEPTSDADMGDTPDSWIGIYVGTAIDDPSDLHYTDLVWYEWRGPKGDGVSYTAQTGTAGLTKTYTMYTADGTPVGSFSVTDGEGAVSTVNGIAPDGDGDVSTVVGSVSDLGLTVGSATIADAYTALLDKQVLICPATDFAVGELPLSGGNRQMDGTIEIVKGATDGWIEFHGRQSSVGDYRMFFTASDVPSGTWNALPPLKSVTYVAWDTCGVYRTDSSKLYVYLPASSLMYGTYSTSDSVGLSLNPGGSEAGVVVTGLSVASFVRSSPDMICVYINKPSTVGGNDQGTFALRGNFTITAN